MSTTERTGHEEVLPPSDGGNGDGGTTRGVDLRLPSPYWVSFPKMLSLIWCPEDGCLGGGALNQTNLHFHSVHHYVWDTIVILEFGNWPYPRCAKCDMFVPQQALNVGTPQHNFFSKERSGSVFYWQKGRGGWEQQLRSAPMGYPPPPPPPSITLEDSCWRRTAIVRRWCAKSNSCGRSVHSWRGCWNERERMPRLWEFSMWKLCRRSCYVCRRHG